MQKIDIKSYEKDILKLKSEIDAYKPFSKKSLQNLKDWFKISFTTHSNAIEGNSFIETEVKVLVEDWITVWWKTVKELRETENLAFLTDTIWDFFKTDFVLTKKFLFDLHKNLLQRIETENLWKYRDIQVYISGSEDQLPKVKEVEKLMKNFVDFANTPEKNTLEKVARLHFDFVKIHPFTDGNGRIARLLMNLYLVKNGFLPIIFPVVTRLDYINSLWKDKKFEDFYKYFLWQTFENYNDYFRHFTD